MTLIKNKPEVEKVSEQTNFKNKQYTKYVFGLLLMIISGVFLSSYEKDLVTDFEVYSPDGEPSVSNEEEDEDIK
ncbi:hypothetical protein [Aquimarina sp. RZ0]|uniref:hypothetical protein n=1 Tax=Aquimarina sp. RZ0 TaxID=2607730 RepID=UPI0011F29789|nr:hypothetical protein [Aquimarina sp. RZ0]KAA1245862.1 hypothetical protein F0000_09900 [Aquimarina sp. RZ0]